MGLQRIIITNAKGGCGKTTIATNIASHYALQGRNVRLFDHDAQGSSLAWINRRPQSVPPITGVDASKNSDHRLTRSWELLTTGGARKRMIRLAVIANRVRKNTLMYHSLERFLFSLNIPFISSLRDTQVYAKAIEAGLGVQEIPGPRNGTDREQWAPIIRWLDTPVVTESAPITPLFSRFEQ